MGIAYLNTLQASPLEHDHFAKEKAINREREREREKERELS